MKNTISDKTEIFDPKIDFGEWCQQDGGIGSPTSHSSTETMTLILKHLEEKFSIQLRSRTLEEPKLRAVKFQWVKRTARSPWQSLPQICFVLRKGSSVMGSVGNMRFWTELLASRGILHEARFYITLSGVLSDLHSRSALSWTGRNKGKGREFPDSQAWLCETGNRYRREVIFLQLELEGVEEPYPSILEHSPRSQFFLASYQTMNNLQSTVAWKLAIKTRCKHPLCSASLG